MSRRRAAFKSANDRRSALVDKMFVQGLTPDEQAEKTRLTAYVETTLERLDCTAALRPSTVAQEEG